MVVPVAVLLVVPVYEGEPEAVLVAVGSDVTDAVLLSVAVRLAVPVELAVVEAVLDRDDVPLPVGNAVPVAERLLVAVSVDLALLEGVFVAV